MSTRCQIGIYDGNDQPLEKFEALLYRHSDGYPSGVLPDIMPFLAWWSKGRGMSDTEYVSARLMQYLCNKYDGNDIKFKMDFVGYDEKRKQIAQKEIDTIAEFTGELGHGICKQFHWDIEYFYAITPEGVVVFDVEDMENNKYKKIGFIPYEKYEESKDYKKLTKEEDGEAY